MVSGMKKSTIVFLFLAILVLGSLELSQYVQNQKRQSEIKSVILGGLSFYSPDEIKKLPIDSYFMFREVLKHLKIEGISSMEDTYDSDPFIRFLNKEKYITSLKFSKPENDSYKVNSEYEFAITYRLDGIVLKALYCDITGYNDEDFSVLQTLNHGGGSYEDTHFLLALLYLKENGCYDKNKIEKLIEEAVGSIINAEKNDTSFSDLYAERIVILYWAGYGRSVERYWIDTVKNNFTDDPGWRINKFLLFSSSHPTGLALLSLIYYLEDKPQQFFY
jgi:hypothetical protein